MVHTIEGGVDVPRETSVADLVAQIDAREGDWLVAIEQLAAIARGQALVSALDNVSGAELWIDRSGVASLRCLDCRRRILEVEDGAELMDLARAVLAHAERGR